jgi:hypothetical protein
MHFICRSFIGSTNNKNWSQHWENEPDDFNLINNKGHLFGLINIYSSDESLDLSQIGREIIEQFNSSYFSSSEPTPQALQSTLQLIKQLEKVQNLSYKIIVACVCNNKLFVVSSPQTSVLICRQNQISQLIEITGQDSFVNGSLSDNDRLFFSTADFFDFVTFPKIQNYLSSDDIQAIEENFISLLYSTDNQDQKAAFLLEVHSEDDQEILDTKSEEVGAKVETKASNIFVKRQNPQQVTKRKKMYLIYAIILLLVLAVGTILGYSKNRLENNQSKYDDYKKQVEEKITNIEVVKNLSFESASEEIIATKKIVEDMAILGINQDEVNDYLTRLENLLTQTGSDSSFTPESFYNTNHLGDNLNFEKIIYQQEILYLLDKTNNSLYSLGYPNKNQNLLYQSEENQNLIDVKVNNQKIYLLNQNEIFEVSGEKLISRLKFEDDIEPIDFDFWNNAIYILDKSQAMIFKYPPNASGFSSVQKWFKNNNQLDANANSIAINGKIWILSSDGTIQPFDRGEAVSFEISPPIESTSTTNLSVTQENDILVFHDESFVYVFKKDGQGLAKYNFADIKIADLTIVEEDNLIFVLGKNQEIYKISL